MMADAARVAFFISGFDIHELCLMLVALFFMPFQVPLSLTDLVADLASQSGWLGPLLVLEVVGLKILVNGWFFNWGLLIAEF